MATNDRPQFSSMSLTALRRYVKDDLGLKGLTKADRETVMAAILKARKPAKGAPKPLTANERADRYATQRNGSYRLTSRQQRRIRQKENRAMFRKAA